MRASDWIMDVPWGSYVVRLHRLSVIVGRNGVGKTSFLRMLGDCVGSLIRRRGEPFFEVAAMELELRVPSRCFSLKEVAALADEVTESRRGGGNAWVFDLLASVFCVSPEPLFLVDGLEDGLHPRAQQALVKVLDRMMEKDLRVRLCATTCSPYLLDACRHENVFVMAGDGEHRSMANLTEHPEFSKWKDSLYPGEMWSFFGEEWVSELKPDRTPAVTSNS